MSKTKQRATVQIEITAPMDENSSEIEKKRAICRHIRLNTRDVKVHPPLLSEDVTLHE